MNRQFPQSPGGCNALSTEEWTDSIDDRQVSYPENITWPEKTSQPQVSITHNSSQQTSMDTKGTRARESYGRSQHNRCGQKWSKVTRQGPRGVQKYIQI